MGSCMSSDGTGEGSSRPTSTQVILPNGTMQEFIAGIVVEQILQSNPACFVCDADSMCYDELVPVMSPMDVLQSDRLYFVLPHKSLSHPLSMSDMAALAVKANLAMMTTKKKNKSNGKFGRSGSIRVMPVCGSPIRSTPEELELGEKREHDFQKRTFSRAKFVSRGPNVRLSTIREEECCC